MRTSPIVSRRRAARTPAVLTLSIIGGISLRFVLAGVAAALACGCASSPRAAHMSEAPYAGPPMSATALAGQHVIVMAAPSGGWSLTLDRARPALGRTEVFLTVKRPDPATMQAAVVVQHEVGSTVPTGAPVDVYARVLDFGARPGDQPYRFVLAVPAAPAPEPPAAPGRPAGQ